MWKNEQRCLVLRPLGADQAIDRSFGVYETISGHQVAYHASSRMESRLRGFCDAFVAPEVRGQGIRVALIEGVIDVFEPLTLKRMLLSEGDAHGLYSKFGFEPLDIPSKWMERVAQQVAR